jgi:hypothetical protein
MGATRAGGGAGRASATVSGGGLRWQGGGSVGWQSGVACLGRASREGLRRWASSGATRGAALEQEVASGGAARRPAAALLRGRGGAEEGERGRQGLRCKLEKLQGPRCTVKFSHCFIPQMRKWSKLKL